MPASLEGRHPAAKTCSAGCKTSLSKRRKRESERRRLSRRSEERASLQDVAKQVAGGEGVVSLAEEVVREELAKYVRQEALTEDVLQDITAMVRFAPAAVQVLVGQLAHSDPDVAQKAAALILKYTMGNPAVAPKGQAPEQGGVTVVFGIPTPDDPDPATAQQPDEVELRVCNDCRETKPADEFVGQSERCVKCFKRMQDDVRARFAPTDPTRSAA